MRDLAYTVSSDEFFEPLLGLEGPDLLEAATRDVFPGRIAVTSSFGAESALLLDMVARIDPATPVIFLDTGKLFPETLEYKRLLEQRLGLSDIRVIQPEKEEVQNADPGGRLFEVDHDACCDLRKAQPLQKALNGFDAWITGRKQFHGGERSALPSVEWAEGRMKINPLAGWSASAVDEAYDQRGLPRHPLTFDGYLSLGCAPCTNKSTCGDSIRAGRWTGSQKTECGIHR